MSFYLFIYMYLCYVSQLCFYIKCEMYSGMRKLRRFVLTLLRTGRSTCKDSGADGRRYLAIIGSFPIPLYIIFVLSLLKASLLLSSLSAQAATDFSRSPPGRWF